MNKNLIITLVLVVVAAGGGFFGGMKYQQSKQPAARQFAGNRTGMVGRQGNAAVFRPVSGDIINADDKSITVKLQDGSSKIVLFSDNMTINKADTASRGDLKVGEKVAVIGQQNSDGSVTAQSIQLNPVLRGPTGNTNP